MTPRSRVPVNPAAAVKRRMLATGGMLLVLVVLGTSGFRYFSGGSWLNCLYMTVTTLTTVGYGEIVPLDHAGRAFVIVYLLLAFGMVSYSAFQIGQWIFTSDMRYLLEKRRMEKDISKFRNHYIVCGAGQMGRIICEQLHERRKPFVVIDVNETTLRLEAGAGEWTYIVGDATDDQVLVHAGIERARALATVLPTDADNVYVVLSARLLSSKLEIVARASDEAAASKLRRAGATRVVSPYSTGAQKMARFMLNPNIEDFLEIADQHGHELELADVQVSAGSPIVGKKLSETHLRESGVIVVGIRRRNGERLMPPPGNAEITAGDWLFVFGSSAAVNRMIEESPPE